MIFTLSAVGESTRLRLVETGFAQAAEDVARGAYKANSDDWDAELAEAGLVGVGEPDGRRQPYRLDPAPIRMALVWLSALATDWDGRLGALDAHLAASAPVESGPATRR